MVYPRGIRGSSTSFAYYPTKILMIERVQFGSDLYRYIFVYIESELDDATGPAIIVMCMSDMC